MLPVRILLFSQAQCTQRHGKMRTDVWKENIDLFSFGKYGGMPLKGMFPHEMALRLVLQQLQTSAGRYKRHIVPLVSCSIDFYLRVFVRVFTSPQEVKKSASNMAIIYECSGCHSYSVQSLGKISLKDNGAERHTPASGPTVNSSCEHCNSIHHVSFYIMKKSGYSPLLDRWTCLGS